MVTNKRIELFKYKDTALIAINTILFYEKRGDFNLNGYVVMPDHIHMICEFLGSGRSPDLPAIIRDIKKYIAKETIEVLKSLDKRMLFGLQLTTPKKRRHTYQLWQPDYYDFNILTESKLNEKLKYMYENPLRKGLCDNPFDYEFSDLKGISGQETRNYYKNRMLT
jgi:REP element-mobilizing transposase RayT